MKRLVLCLCLLLLSFPLYGESFVTREGNRLMLDGKSFYFSGTNQYYLFYKSKFMVDDVMERAQSMGLNVMRTWAFCDGEYHGGHSLQPEPGVYREETFRNLDYLIYKAESMGIRLVLSLVNNWESFGGMQTYVKWSKTAQNHDDFYSDQNTRKLFKNYVSYILNRVNTYTGRAYKDEPAIMMWELANEPRVTPSRVSELYRWLDEMAAHVKSIDKNHLVSTGSEGDYATDVFQTHQSAHIDVVSFHVYPDHWGWGEAQTKNFIKRQISVAHSNLKKPVFAGEFGIFNRSARDRVFSDWYTLFKENNIDGSLFWILSGLQDDGSFYPDYDGFTVYYPGDKTTSGIIQNFSQWALQKTGLGLDRFPPVLSLKTPIEGQDLKGSVVFSGDVSDEGGVKEVTLDFGAVERQAIVLGGKWQYAWDSRERLDGHFKMTLRARDLEGNEFSEIREFSAANGMPTSDQWQSSGQKFQDDGFHFIYQTSLKNMTAKEVTGNFVARFYMKAEGDQALGSHYEYSERYVGNPILSKIVPYHQEVQYYEIDMGKRTLSPGEFIGFKGQISQQNGGFKSYNDWTAGDFSESLGSLSHMAWFLDGRLIAGQIP